MYVLWPTRLAVLHGSELVTFLSYDQPIDMDLLQRIEEDHKP